MMSGMDLANSWRPMTLFDIEALQALNPDIESPYLIFEKLRLFPQGCFVLTPGSQVDGYFIGYPWATVMPVPRETPIDHVPSATDAVFVIHDLFIQENYRRNGLASRVVDGVCRNLERAVRKVVARTPTLYVPFWEKQGFVRVARLAFDEDGAMSDPAQGTQFLMIRDMSDG